MDKEEDIVDNSFFETTVLIEESSFNNKGEEDAPALTMVISDLQIVCLMCFLTMRNSQQNMAGISLWHHKGNVLAIGIFDSFTFPISVEEGTANTNWLWQSLLDGLLKGRSDACKLNIRPSQQNNNKKYKIKSE